jgi:hypothetical protein
METLAQILSIYDLKTKIRQKKQRIENIKKFQHQIKQFSFLLNSNFLLPVDNLVYQGKIAYIDFIFRSDSLFLCLNCIYNKRGKIESVEVATKHGVILKLTDLKGFRTLSGKKFKRKINVKNIGLVDVVRIEKLIANKETIKVIENSFEKFSLREKIRARFDIHSTQNCL